MNRTRFALTMVAFAVLSLTPAFGQHGTPATGEWRVNGGDTGSTRYSPLDQINATNVKNLQVVWRWKAQNMGPTPQAAWEVTPLMVGGKLYVTAGTGRTVVPRSTPPPARRYGCTTATTPRNAARFAQ